MGGAGTGDKLSGQGVAPASGGSVGSAQSQGAAVIPLGAIRIEVRPCACHVINHICTLRFIELNCMLKGDSYRGQALSSPRHQPLLRPRVS